MSCSLLSENLSDPMGLDLSKPLLVDDSCLDVARAVSQRTCNVTLVIETIPPIACRVDMAEAVTSVNWYWNVTSRYP